MADSFSSHQPKPSRTSESDVAASQRRKYAGKRLGKFQIVGELGRGGMGIVFEALDTVLERHVAIKMLPRSVSALPDSLERFLREARAAAKLNHPHVVAVYDADQFNGQYYIVLELVRGGSLQDSLKTGPLPWIEATRVMADACRGLDAAHSAGLVHRDIKPSNLMRSEDGIVKLADFGLVRGLDSTGATMTGSGSVLGTPQFMSPEQCRSETADERSDIYSMGATYFALLTGQVPYPGNAPLLVMNSHLLDPIPDPREFDSTIPPSCSAIIQRAMAKDPDDRYRDAQSLLADLENVLAEANEEDASTPLPLAVQRPATGAAITAKAAFTAQLQRPVSEVRRSLPTRRIAQIGGVGILVVGVVWLCGGLLGSKGSKVESSHPSEQQLTENGKSPPRDSEASRAPEVAPPQKTRVGPSTPVVTVSANAFHLPGMTIEKSATDLRREVWSMDYPGITGVYVAKSAEFLMVLTNSGSEASPSAVRGHVTVWSREGKRLLDESIVGRATCGAISASGRRLVVGTAGGAGVLQWNAKTWQREKVAEVSNVGDVDAVALSEDGRWMAFSVTNATQDVPTANKDGAWILWHLVPQKLTKRSTVKGSGRFRAITFAPDKELFVVTGSDDGYVRRWKGLQAEQAARPYVTGQRVHSLDCRGEGDLQATGYGSWVSLWDYRRNIRTYVWNQQSEPIATVAFSPDGRQLSFASGSMVRIVDADSHGTVETLEGFGGSVLSLAYVPDGTRLFTASSDGKLKLFQLAPKSN